MNFLYTFSKVLRVRKYGEQKFRLMKLAKPSYQSLCESIIELFSNEKKKNVNENNSPNAARRSLSFSIKRIVLLPDILLKDDEDILMVDNENNKIEVVL